MILCFSDLLNHMKHHSPVNNVLCVLSLISQCDFYGFFFILLCQMLYEFVNDSYAILWAFFTVLKFKIYFPIS